MGFTGGTANRGNMFIALKPLKVRKVSADVVINRLRPQLSRIPAATLFLQAAPSSPTAAVGSSKRAKSVELRYAAAPATCDSRRAEENGESAVRLDNLSRVLPNGEGS
jgi:multidrug efflux pump subunit AcrB